MSVNFNPRFTNTSQHTSTSDPTNDTYSRVSQMQTKIYDGSNQNTEGKHLLSATQNGNLQVSQQTTTSSTMASASSVQAFIETSRSPIIGNIPLHLPAGEGNLALVQSLIYQGQNPHAINNLGSSIGHFAASSGNVLLMQFLVEEYKIDLSLKDFMGKTFAHYAAQSGSLEMVIYLQQKGIDLHALTDNNESALFFAAESGNIDLMRHLISNGICPHAVDKQGGNILFWAVFSQKFEALKYLIEEQHVSTRAVDDIGCTLLHMATEAFLDDKGMEIIVYLTEQQFLSPNTPDKSGQTALDYARDNELTDVIDYFTKALRRTRLKVHH